MAITNIGLALSGGGFRAAVFHMGVLARLADDKLLEEVIALSTVSGGSLVAGLIFSHNGLRWPTSDEYYNTVVSKARTFITTQDLQSGLIERFLYSCLTLQLGTLLTRSVALSQALRDRWQITTRLSDLPDRPRWSINATCYESGKDWRFEKKCAGDYRFGYTHQTDRILLSDALAASAGFPGLVGALAFDMRRHDDWQPDTPASSSQDRLKASEFPIVHLWDGGVYDNNGLEVFHDFNQSRWQRNIDFLIVSDVSGQMKAETYRIGVRAVWRIVTGVLMEQIRSLRARAVLALMSKPNTQAKGAYLRVGNTCEGVLGKAKVDPAIVDRLKKECLPPDVVAATEHLQTEIRRLTPSEFETLFRHGYEVADYTLLAHHPAEFQHRNYLESRWASHGS